MTITSRHVNGRRNTNFGTGALFGKSALKENGFFEFELWGRHHRAATTGGALTKMTKIANLTLLRANDAAFIAARRRATAFVGGLLLSAYAVPVNAADLGGNCCADLEERIAELEATTARKGNRKVKLEISGHVNQGILAWDDGFESNAGIYTNDNSRTRFRFRGSAKISDDWTAGYIIEIGVRSANSKRFTQSSDDGGDNPADVGFDLRDSSWFVASKTYGQANVGLGATATDAITEINQTQTSEFSKFSDVEDTGLGLNLRRRDGALSSRYQYRRLIGVNGDQPGDGERRFNGVKYTTPEIAGFTITGFWGEDDFSDVALRYKGEIGQVKVAAGIGYGHITDGLQTQTGCAVSQANAGTTPIGASADADCSQFGGSVSALHVPTGLFLNFGAGEKQDDLISDITLYSGAVAPDDTETFWALQAGIEKKWTSFGATTIYGEYYDYSGGSNNRTIEGAFAGVGTATGAVLDSSLTSYGGGIAQGFDAASLVMYVTYRHVEGDLTASSIAGGRANAAAINTVDIEDLDLVFAGGIIKF